MGCKREPQFVFASNWVPDTEMGLQKRGVKCPPWDVTPLGRALNFYGTWRGGLRTLGDASTPRCGTKAPWGSLLTQASKFLAALLNHGSVFFQVSPQTSPSLSSHSLAHRSVSVATITPRSSSRTARAEVGKRVWFGLYRSCQPMNVLPFFR